MEKSERFALVLSPAEKTALARLAELEGGLSLATVVRLLIRKAAHERGLWPSPSIPNASQQVEGMEDRQ